MVTDDHVGREVVGFIKSVVSCCTPEERGGRDRTDQRRKKERSTGCESCKKKKITLSSTSFIEERKKGSGTRGCC